MLQYGDGCCSVTKSCLTLSNPKDCSTPGFPVPHLSKVAQVHVHCISDAIQPSHHIIYGLLKLIHMLQYGLTAKDHKVYDSIYMKCPEMANQQRQKEN